MIIPQGITYCYISTECMPDVFVLAEIRMKYTNKSKNGQANYRDLGLLNHRYKIFYMVILLKNHHTKYHS